MKQAEIAKTLLGAVALAAASATVYSPALASERLAQVRAESRKESVSRAEAMAIARRHGVDRIVRIEYAGSHWRIEGVTRDGRSVEMTVDVRTGQVGSYRVGR